MSSTIAAAALGALTIGTGQPAPARAAIPPETPLAMSRVYAIPEGSLGAALNTFADKSGLHILYDSRVTRRMRSAGLRGAFSVKDGLDRLLGGTGLSYRFSDDGESVSILLAQNDTGVRSDAGAQALPPIDVGAEDRRARTEQSGARRGPGDRFTGYRPASSAPTTLKTDTPLMQTPISVQSVMRQTMDDKQAITIRDALISNVSGVTLVPNFFDNVVNVRGFAATTYRNGLMEQRYRHLDTANLQSIDVLKGPAAMLFGRMEPGGIVNLVVKRPLETPYYSVTQQLGSYGLTRTTVDATGPVTTDKSVLYRFNGEFFRTDSYRDLVNDRNVFLAPTITLHPIEQFRMNIDFEYDNRTWVDDYPIYPAVGGGPAKIPRSRYLSPAFVTARMPNNMDKKRIAYDWTYDVLPGWSVTNRLSYSNTGTQNENGFPLGLNEATGVMNRFLNVFPGFTDKNFATNLDVKGKFATGPLEHSILVGFDYFNYFTPLYPTTSIFASAVNIYAPNYKAFEDINVPLQYQVTGQKWTGVYGQDMISFLDDKVHLLLGGRYDWAETSANRDRASAARAAASYSTSFDSGFSPRIGLLYQPLPWLSFYGNFTQSIGANQLSPQGLTLSPQKGEQYEGGLKAELLDERLLLTIAYFDITKTNVPVTDPANAANRLLIGKARSQGVEIDLTGQIDDNWSVIANYTHDDVRTVVGTATDPDTAYKRQLAVAGSILPGSPRNYGNLWVKYDAHDAFEGLSLGAGVTASSDQLGDTANSFVLPSYALVNGMIAYRAKIEDFTVTAQLNVKNIADTVYYPAANSRSTIMTGPPRTFLGSLRVEF